MPFYHKNVAGQLTAWASRVTSIIKIWPKSEAQRLQPLWPNQSIQAMQDTFETAPKRGKREKKAVHKTPKLCPHMPDKLRGSEGCVYPYPKKLKPKKNKNKLSYGLNVLAESRAGDGPDAARIGDAVTMQCSRLKKPPT